MSLGEFDSLTRKRIFRIMKIQEKRLEREREEKERIFKESERRAKQQQAKQAAMSNRRGSQKIPL